MSAVNNVWNQTLRTLILKNQFELSGVDSSKDHIEFILSQNPSFNSDPRFLNDAGIFEIDKFIDLIVELKTTSPESYEQWQKQELIFQNQSNEKIYSDLIKSGVNFSFKDGEFEYFLQNDRVDIDYVQIPYNSIPDSLIKLKNSDVISGQALEQAVQDQLRQGIEPWEAFLAGCISLGGQVKEDGPESFCQRPTTGP